MIHALADCQSVHIGQGTRIWQFCVVLPGARIGAHCNICMNVLVESGAVVGDHCTVKPGVQLWDGVTLGDYVFVGANTVFTNDRVPRSQKQGFVPVATIVETGATIGAGCTIMPGLTIGHHAFIGAGSVVTRDVPPHTVWYGNPARHRGYITADGTLLDMHKRDKQGNIHNDLI